MSAPMIEAAGLTKEFGDLVAVSNVSFRIGPGVTALLGPNGAGKSTLLRMLCGLAKPTVGNVRILGSNVRDNVRLRSQIGIVPQQEQLFDHMSLSEFVRTAAALNGVENIELAAETAISFVGLDSTDKRRLGDYSKGMRQRAKVAQAIVHEPKVMFLDEPLSGLDPGQRSLLIDLFHRIGDTGRCVLVSSHVLEEVERMGSNVLIIGQGRLLAEGDFRGIRDLMDDRPRRFKIVVERAQQFAGTLLAKNLVEDVEVPGDTELTLATSRMRDFSASIAPLAKEQGVSITEIRPLDADLESVFRYLLERAR